jgi:hypothetical protein
LKKAYNVPYVAVCLVRLPNHKSSLFKELAHISININFRTSNNRQSSLVELWPLILFIVHSTSPRQDIEFGNFGPVSDMSRKGR